MSSETYTEEINVSNILTLNFTYIEEKLKKNFEIIARRLSKLEGLFTIEDKLKGMERESKFLSMKLDNVIMKIPEISMGVSPETVKVICDEQMKEYMNSSHDNLKSTRFYHEVKDAVTRGLRDETKIPPPVTMPATLKRKEKNEKVEKVEYEPENLPLKYKINRDEFVKDMTKEEIHFTDKILKEEKTAEEMILEVAMKLRIFIRDYEQTRIAKGSLEFVNKSLDKYEQFESYENKSFSKKASDQKDRTKTRIQRGKDNPEEFEKKHLELLDKSKSSEVEKRQDKTAAKVDREGMSLRRISSKNQQNTQSYNRLGEQTESRSKSLIKAAATAKYDQFPKVEELKTSKKKSGVEQTSGNNLKSQVEEKKYNHHNIETSKRQYRSTLTKMHNKKSLVKMLAPEFDFKETDGNKNIIITLRHLEKATDQKVNKDVFINVVQELEEKIQALRHAKDLSDTAEIKKFCMSIENRMQSIIAFIQQLQDQEDPLVAKKKWSCISCDRQSEKYSGRVGSHLNWDSLGGKKLSPVKVGAFGQTVMFASKVRNLINIGDIPE